MNSLEAFEFTGIFFLYTIPNTVKKKCETFNILFKAKCKTFSSKVRKIIKD